jgi:hypothetical protein
MMRRCLIISILFLNSGIITVFATDLKLTVDNQQPVALSRYFTTVLLGKTLNLKVEYTDINNIVITSDYGKLEIKGEGRWKYTAPQKSGNYSVTIKDQISNKEIVLIIFVLTPISEKKGEYLNNYRIGNYPKEGYKGKRNYSRPKGFIAVTESNKELFITPHFQLKQFLCRQSSDWPKYILLNPVLLVKLVQLIDGLASNGVKAKTLFIMSGYRTPYSNKAIGNVKFSRHIYGDAADVYIDENLDGVIDDLDNNNFSNMLDAMVLHEVLCEIEKDPENEHLIGGIGKYNKNSAHTYFIHVDTRGYKARW